MAEIRRMRRTGFLLPSFSLVATPFVLSLHRARLLTRKEVGYAVLLLVVCVVDPVSVELSTFPLPVILPANVQLPK
jgi:hypothetical protein